MATRDALISRMHDRLIRGRAPRLQLGIIVTLAGSFAFLTSVVCLRLGLESMAIRYPLAVVAGYLMFLALIRGWIGWQRHGRSMDPLADLASNVDVSHVTVPTRHAPIEPWHGGRSGGGGGGGGSGWAEGFSTLPTAGGRGSSAAIDLDEAWPVVLAAICAVGGLLAILYVIYAAPVLLAEVALDAAVISALYRRLGKKDVSHWAATVVRRTWMPALVLVVFSAVGGYALDQVSPDARSLGAAIREMRD